MDKQRTKFITTTGILIALTVMSQLLGRVIPLGSFNNFITGPLVNACLFISASLVGPVGSGIVALISPFCAYMLGVAVPLPFLPFVAVGNFILVLTAYFLRGKKYMAIAAAAIIKAAFLYAAITFMLGVMNLPAPRAQAMTFLFSWPQLVTALIGGAISLVALSRINIAVKA